MLCQNNIISEREMADVMTHELVHAYDNCRGKVDFTNLKHLACTEVRALRALRRFSVITAAPHLPATFHATPALPWPCGTRA